MIQSRVGWASLRPAGVAIDAVDGEDRRAVADGAFADDEDGRHVADGVAEDTSWSSSCRG